MRPPESNNKIDQLNIPSDGSDRSTQPPHLPALPSARQALSPAALQVSEPGTLTSLYPQLVAAHTSDEQLIELWLHGRPAETQRAYRTDARAFLALTRCTLRTVTLAELQAFADSLAMLAPATRARHIKAVKSLFSFAYRCGYVPVNVGAALRIPPVEDRLAARILTEEQVQRMLAREEHPRNHALLRLLYGAGLRVSELTRLTWANLAPRGDRGQVSVFGKGGKTRSVLISAATWQEIMDLRGSAPSDAPVFTSRGGGAHASGGRLDPSQVRRVVAAAAHRAGIDGNVSPHWLRHAHASHALDRGAPMSLICETLGHASMAVTGRYLHARPQASSSDYLPV